VGVNGVGKKAYQFVEKLWAIRRVGYLLDEIQLRGKSQEIIDELVRLSRDYGIMTPYTSFLADDRSGGRIASAPMGKGGARHMAEEALARFSEPAGAKAQADAVTRQVLRGARRAPAPTAPGRSAGQMYGWGRVDAYEEGKKQDVRNVRQVGQQALYRRGRVWFAANAAEVDLAKDKEKVRDVQRFGKAYFALVRANTVEENQVLASQRADEELVISLRGQLYRIR